MPILRSLVITHLIDEIFVFTQSIHCQMNEFLIRYNGWIKDYLNGFGMTSRTRTNLFIRGILHLPCVYPTFVPTTPSCRIKSSSPPQKQPSANVAS